MTIKNNITMQTLDKLDKLIGNKLTFGGMLANIRECDEISQVAFAKILGISRHYLCDIEHNRRAVSPKTAFEYATKLGYDTGLFVKLAIQSLIDNAGLEFDINLTVRKKHKNKQNVNQFVSR